MPLLDPFTNVLLAVNIGVALMVAVYALHQGVLLFLFLRARRRPHIPPAQSPTSGDLPYVTVQAPLYNERFVAQRLIAALSALDYPRDRLQIQILDDSTDDTPHIVRAAVDAAVAAGIPIELIHRDHRAGFKGGAMDNALHAARGEFIAIFDADFAPRADFLRGLCAPAGPFSDPAVGFVQTRWGYLNRDDSLLTRAQALLLDMHFGVDQPARSAWRLPMNFNGSAGVWRRACIDDAGGWEFDTLTEDLDLSYRAQLRGWRGVYLLDVVAPSELPETVISFKRQQARWARGTVQCLRKLGTRLLRSSLSPACKVAGLMHLSGYMTYPLLLLLALSSPLLAIKTYGERVIPGWMSLISLAGLLPMVSMFVAHRQQGRSARMFARDLPVAIMLGIGLAWSNTAAMFAGLASRASGVFVRTPKTAPRVADGAADSDAAGDHADGYPETPDWTMAAEFCMALYVLGVCLVLAHLGEWLTVFPLLLYGLSFAGVALSQFAPMARRKLQRHHVSRMRAPSAD
ncbi:MAG: glycosyltransferase family 2 protein [Anaerolineae bacterium]